MELKTKVIIELTVQDIKQAIEVWLRSNEHITNAIDFTENSIQFDAEFFSGATVEFYKT